MTHLIEVVGHADLPRHKAETPRGRSLVKGDDLHHRASGLGNDERLATSGFFNELREMGLGFVHIDGAHWGSASKAR